MDETLEEEAEEYLVAPYKTFKPSIHMSEQGHSIFICWKPSYDDCHHRITKLNGGSFEVTCCHTILDKGSIRSQVKFLLARKK